jgi:hypothetical protein
MSSVPRSTHPPSWLFIQNNIRDEYKIQSSWVCNCLHLPVTSALLRSNISMLRSIIPKQSSADIGSISYSSVLSIFLHLFVAYPFLSSNTFPNASPQNILSTYKQCSQQGSLYTKHDLKITTCFGLSFIFRYTISYKKTIFKTIKRPAKNNSKPQYLFFPYYDRLRMALVWTMSRQTTYGTRMNSV